MENVLIIGDSWASAVVEDGGTDWPTILGVPESHKQAISGSTAKEWAEDKDGILTKAIETPADTVIVSLLGNDMIQAVSDNCVTKEEVFEGVMDMRRVILTFSMTRQRILVMLYSDPFSGSRPESRIGVAFLNAVIMAACQGVEVEFISTQVFLDFNCFNGQGIHPRQYGHKIMAENIGRML